MDKILQMDYERALRSNHPRFVQEVVKHFIKYKDSLGDYIDPLNSHIFFLQDDCKRKSSFHEKMEKFFWNKS